MMHRPLMPRLLTSLSTASHRSPSINLQHHHHVHQQRRFFFFVRPQTQRIILAAATQQRRRFSIYGFGEQWTGALSRGPHRLSIEEAPELSYDEIHQLGVAQTMVPLLYNNDGEEEDNWKCIAASAGWGHTAIIIDDDKSEEEPERRRLLICGRPHDFQTLMRLRRLPTFVRNFCVRYSFDGTAGNDTDLSQQQPSPMQRIASYLAGENEVTFHEDECRRFGNVPTLLQVELPSKGERPALEGERIDDVAFTKHASSSSASIIHKQYQNTLATSAGLTAIISNTGTLYCFGLNHRGQCGIGSFNPNIWTPTSVTGLASTRFILDHGNREYVGDDMFREFRQQQNPIVSVALGLQHGVALDSEGQVFCWGKGERGQLGQGRRTIVEEREENPPDDENSNNRDDGNIDAELGEATPTENRTFEYALHVPNFHDPFYATTAAAVSTSSSDIYVPLLSEADSKVKYISAGMNFTMAVTQSNLPYIWGKNVRLNPSYSSSQINIRTKPVLDSTYPRYIPGLPQGLIIERIACGSHHASMLLSDGSVWAVGVATDKPIPLWDEAVEILASGVVDMSELISFTAGFDRTVVVSGSSSSGGNSQQRQVIEVQLWSSEELRQQGAVRPSWVDWVESEKGHEKICSIHRGWKHSIVRTER
jgi:alpha-tubulin suppressor-like RCC1 family protein